MAWRKGARFDAWDDWSNYDAWDAAIGELGIDLDFYLYPAARGAEQFSPWGSTLGQGGAVGIRAAFLLRETSGAASRGGKLVSPELAGTFG